MDTRGAIVVGGHVNGLGLVRALAARNVRTAVITTKPYDIAHRSRWISSRAAALDIEEQPQVIEELLARRASDWSGWALFPANDGALAALARHHDALSSNYRVIAPPWEVARYFLDKSAMLDAAGAVGIDLPHCYGPAVASVAARAEVRFPVVIKPIVGYRFFSRFGCKLLVARDRAELVRCVARLADAQMPGQIFDLIPGPDSQIYAYCTYIDAYGEPRGGLTVRKLRQSPPFFGVARIAEITDDDPRLCEATIELLRRVGFRGMAAAEFKLDPRNGRLQFLEINGRSVIYNALLRRGGLDLGALAWSEHMCGHVETARANGWRGVWIHLHADVLYSVFYRRQHRVAFSDAVAPYRRPKVYAVWSARDPGPFITQWARTTGAGAAALWRGTHRERLADRTLSASSGELHAGADIHH